MNKKNEIKLDKEAILSAAFRGADDGVEGACRLAFGELVSQMRTVAPMLPSNPWDALAALLGAYVTAATRSNQDPLAAYDAARAALRALPTFAEIEEGVAADIGRPLQRDECAAIIGTLDAVSRGLVNALRLSAEPDQKPIGIPDPPPPPPPTKVVERDNYCDGFACGGRNSGSEFVSLFERSTTKTPFHFDRLAVIEAQKTDTCDAANEACDEIAKQIYAHDETLPTDLEGQLWVLLAHREYLREAFAHAPPPTKAIEGES